MSQQPPNGLQCQGCPYKERAQQPDTLDLFKSLKKPSYMDPGVLRPKPSHAHAADKAVMRKTGTREYHEGTVVLPRDPKGWNPFTNPKKDEALPIAEIKVVPKKPVVDHNMPCYVCGKKPAVYNGNDGIFLPCWGCQKEGWKLEKKCKSLLQRLFGKKPKIHPSP